jgi:hypothetical protein
MVPSADGSPIGNWAIVGASQSWEALQPDSNNKYIAVNASNNISTIYQMSNNGPVTDGDVSLKLRARKVSGESIAYVLVSLHIVDDDGTLDLDGNVYQSESIVVVSDSWSDYEFVLPEYTATLVLGLRYNLWSKIEIASDGNDEIQISALWLEVPQSDKGTFIKLPSSYPPIDQMVTVETYQGRYMPAKWDGGYWLDSEDNDIEYTITDDNALSVLGWHL